MNHPISVGSTRNLLLRRLLGESAVWAGGGQPVPVPLDLENMILNMPFSEGSGFITRNLVTPNTDTNFCAFPEGPFSNAGIAAWNVQNGSATITDGLTDPVGGTAAGRMAGDTTAFFGRYTFLELGDQITISVQVKSNTGLAQQLRFVANNQYSAVKNVTTGWTTITHTYINTLGEGFLYNAITSNGVDAVDVLFYGWKFETGAVATPYQSQVGDGAIWVEPSGGSQSLPNWTAQGVNFVGTTTRGGGHVAATFSQAKPVSNVTIYGMFKWNVGSLDEGYHSILASDNNNGPMVTLDAMGGWINANPPYPGARYYNTQCPATGGVTDDGAWHLMTMTYDGATIKVYIDTTQVGETAAPGLPALSLSNLYISQIQTYRLPGVIAYITMYDVAHDRAKITSQFSAYKAILASRGATLSLPTRYIAAEGDSITAANPSYAPLGAKIMGSTQVHNGGASGAGIGYVEANAAFVDTLKVAGVVNMYSILIGYNDSTVIIPVDFVARLKALCLARRAAGWNKIIVCTVLPASTPGGFNTWRNSVNAMIRADPSFYDILADFGADPVMGPDNAPTNPTLYSADGIHPTALGQQNLSVVYAAAVAP